MKNHTNILVYNISYKTLMDTKPMYIRFNKMDGFTRVYAGTRYLVLFGGKKCDSIYNRIRSFVGVISGLTYVISHNWENLYKMNLDALKKDLIVNRHTKKNI